MRALLEKVSAVPGVIGSAILGQDGHCVVDSLTAPYEPVLLEEALTTMRQVAEHYGHSAELDANQTFVVSFDEGHLLGRSAGRHEILVLCRGGANLAMVNVALNVAVLKIARHPTLVEIARRPVQKTAGPVLQQALATVDPSSMSWTADRGDKTTKGAVGLRVMQHLLKTYIKYAGAEGRSTLEQELRSIGATPQSLSAAQFADLLRAVARRIPDPERRRRFVADALGDKRRRL